MECNKEEACKAYAIAERKFTETDINGAKRFAMKAHNLYPNLDGLPQLISTLDVYISSEKRINGEVNWYEVLGVEPSADGETIRKQYRKLALILHPDKNKSVGAEGAFKILSEAWSLLSDKAKKFAYDQKCKLQHMNHGVPSWKSSTTTSSNGFHTQTTAKPTFPNSFHNLFNSDARAQKSAMHVNSSQVPLKPSFWTMCHSCRTHFEYLRDYINQNLLCQSCRQPFFAVETPPPIMKGKNSATLQNSHLSRQNRPQQMRGDRLHSTAQKSTAMNVGPAVRTGSSNISGSNGNVYSAAFTGNMLEKLKRKLEQASMSPKEELFRTKKPANKKSDPGVSIGSSPAGFVPEADRQSKIRVNEQKVNNNVKGRTHPVSRQSGGVGNSGSVNNGSRVGRAKPAVNSRLDRTRELLISEIRNMLIEKARKAIHEKLKGWSGVAAVSKTSEKEIGKKEKETKKAVNVMKTEANNCPDLTNTKQRVQTKESAPAREVNELEVKDIDAMSMSVPDPEFHDFDNDRKEKSFGENEVWAAYDDDDGMPRFYAMIHGVTSWKPFKMRISWLNSKSNRELGPLNWIGSGFYKTSGEFWVGKHEGYNSINSFSHKVNWMKGVRGAILIYPRKGDVWALYKKWSPDWNELTSDEIIHKYEMIEVLEDYKEDIGVTVAPLVKVADYKNVFCRHPDCNKFRTIPREEMFQLSHQVPSCLLTGQEGTNAPKGCLELDPASLPLELLQVYTEEQLEEMLKVDETIEVKDLSGNLKNSKGKQTVECPEMTKAKEHAVGMDSAGGVSRNVKGTKSGELLAYKRRKLL